MPFLSEKRQRQLLLLLTFFTFFTLLGSRALNEPDEGRYSEVAREMIETGDWLVPHLWYLPHLDKPPMTYWLEAAAIKYLGLNEWAVRLPLALAGISGVWATYLLGCTIGGRRTGWWSALILQSSLLYFAMARMLTTDLFLTQFNVWTLYFFWRSWQCLNLERPEQQVRKTEFFGWHLAGWTALAPGFLTKGPVAVAIPLAAFGALMIFRHREWPKIWLAGLGGGFVWFCILIAPWFLAVFQRESAAAHYMILGQAAGHLLGTTIKNRSGSIFYFFGIIAVGFLPWTILLGWLWRRRHWQGLNAPAKDAWLMLNVWAMFTFALFSFSHAKLPAYILPIFPALAILVAWRFFGEEETSTTVPGTAWRICAVCALLLPAIFPLILMFAFHDTLPAWVKWQSPIILAIMLAVIWWTRQRNRQQLALLSVGLALLGFLGVAGELPGFETTFRANQTLKPLGQALHEHFQPGDTVVCWGRLPQGLPFYAGGAISAENLPYLGGMDLTQVPFEYPGNRERMGDRLLADENALAELLHARQHVLLVGIGSSVPNFLSKHQDVTLHKLTVSGQWQIYSN